MQLRDVNLCDPDVFAAGVPHEMFGVLRREDPVHWHDEPGGPGFWCITKHADVRHVSRNPEVFSSQAGATLIRDPSPAELPMLQAIMLNMDPPQHRQYRALVNKGFTPRRVSDLEGHVEAKVGEILDRVVERGECDFVRDVAGPLPMEVICELMGVPAEDRQRVYDISNMMVGHDDPDFADPDAPIADADYQTASAEMFMYATKLAERARRQPADDLGTALLEAEVDGHHLSELDYNSFFLLLAVAGNETTRTVTCNGVIELLRHPEQLARLQADLSLVPVAVEEMIRFNPPVHYFRRTVLADTEIRGTRLRAGDKLTLWYPSANRDEEVFPDGDRFDTRRTPNDHLGFGIGEHFCLGANLARLELRVMIREVLRRLPDLELTAEPGRLRSNFINGVKTMPVRFAPSKPLGAAVA
jgi:cholest-4-en-3-one 26-monooxygenase